MNQDYAIEVTTEPMPFERVAEEISVVYSLLQSLGVNEVRLMYGMACDDMLNEQWKWIAMQATDVPQHVKQAIENGGYPPGLGDLFIEAAEPRFEILFCNDADLHFRSDDVQAATKAIRFWQARGLSGWIFRRENEESQRWYPDTPAKELFG